MQDGKPRLLGYASKSLPDGCKNYSITELEMTGLVINIHLWKHLLLRVEFDCAVDHRALPYIMKSKNLPATGRIIRLLEHLAGYSFNLYYVKGKDMILSDYLSRIAVDNRNPEKVIPISFNALAQYRLAIDHITESFMTTNFMVATRSKTSTAGIKLSPVHGAQKGVDPALKPESQAKSKKVLLKPTIQSPIKSPSQTPVTVKTPVSRLRTPGIVNSLPIVPGSLLNTPAKTNAPVVIQTPAGPRRIPHNTPNQTLVRHTVSKQPNSSPAQLASRKLIQKSVKLLNTLKLKTSDKISPQTPQPVAPFPLRDQTLNTETSPVEIPLAKPTLMHRHLPKQTDVDRIMEQINRKYLTNLQLPCSIRDMQAAYLNSPHIKDIYMAVGMNKMPSKARTARKLESDLMNAVYMIHRGYGIHVTTASPTNHQSLMAEHGIKSLANILMKHLTGLGDSWPSYCKPAMLSYNSYATPNLENLSPFEIAIGRKATLAPKFEYKPRIPITGTHAETKEKLQEKLAYFRKRLEDFRSNRMAIINKDRQPHGFTVGQIGPICIILVVVSYRLVAENFNVIL